MKPLSEQNHYEILEVTADATLEEIERSYALAQSTYQDEALGGHSMFSEGEAEAIRDRVEAAYRVLSNEDARRAYDDALTVERAVVAADPVPEVETAPPENPAPMEEFEELDEEADDFDGPRLRRSRLRRGMEIEQIATVTKINPTYLRFIEEERFGDLPAPVYVRGFVSAYASCVGLDSRRVSASYMKRFEENRTQRKRGRFFD